MTKFKIEGIEESGIGRIFQIGVAADEFEREFNRRLSGLASKVKLPGFRPGKAPLPVLRTKYGSRVREEATGAMVDEVCNKVVREAGKNVVGRPEVLELRRADDGGFTVSLMVMRLDDFRVEGLADLKIERYVAQPTDKEIDEALARVADSRPRSKPVGKARPARDGDTLVLDFSGTVDGKVFDGGSAEDFSVLLGENAVLPDFEKGVRSMKVGEEKSFSLTFPEDYNAAALAGKRAVFSAKLKDHREPLPGKVDAELAKGLGLESVEALRDMVKDSLSHQYRRLSDRLARRELLDRMNDAYGFEVPERVVDREFASIWRQVEAAKSRNELGENEAKLSDDELREEYRRIAERRTRLGLVISHVAKVREITVGDREVERAMNEEMQRNPAQAERIQAAVKRDPGLRGVFEGPLLEDKVLSWIMRRVEVAERKVSSEKLMDLARESDDVEDRAKSKKRPAKSAASKGSRKGVKSDGADKTKSSAAAKGGDDAEKAKSAAAASAARGKTRAASSGAKKGAVGSFARAASKK